MVTASILRKQRERQEQEMTFRIAIVSGSCRRRALRESAK
jgi:hypothetical protein